MPVPRAATDAQTSQRQPGAVGGEDAVESRPFGIILKVTPEATKKGHLFLRIELEVTSVAFPDAEAANGETIPTFHTRQVNTSAAMRRGDTLVVTGLVAPEQKQEFAQLPHLAQIPIIGRLWKSEDFRQGKTDLIFFLTPMVEGQQAKMEVLGGA